MALAEDALNVHNSDFLKISAPEWAGVSGNAAKRVKITKILNASNFAINTFLLKKESIEDYAEEAVDAQGTGVVDGIVWAFANYDGTDDTGKIEEGKPVVFCTKTGNCVTGINSSWSKDEYKIVGTALKSHEEAGEPKRIPIRLTAVAKESQDEVYVARAKLETGSWPTLQSWSAGIQYHVWEFQLLKSSYLYGQGVYTFPESGNGLYPALGFHDPAEWSDDYVTALNLLGGWYVPENTILQITKKHGRYVFQHKMPAVLFGTLTSDLLGANPASATVNYGTGSMNVFNGKLGNTGYKIPANAKFAASADEINLFTSGGLITYNLTAVDVCPVPES